MIERLARALEHIEEVPEDVQEELAGQIEEYTASMSDTAGLPMAPDEASLPKVVRDALAVIGTWRDLQDDDEFEALDRIRHANQPSPPIDLGDL